MIYKTLHDIRTNYDLQNTTSHSNTQCSTKIYMTEGKTMIYKTLHDIGTNNDLQNTTWHRGIQWSANHYMT
jgi:hypothetical protein